MQERDLARARDAYTAGRIDVAELELLVEHVLRGGYLDAMLTRRSPLLDKVRAERRRRVCKARGHHGDFIEITGLSDLERRYACSDCGIRRVVFSQFR